MVGAQPGVEAWGSPRANEKPLGQNLPRSSLLCLLSQHSREQRNGAGPAFKAPAGRLSACGRMLFPHELSHPKCQGLIKQLCPLLAH